jgi:hypothetical protein
MASNSDESESETHRPKKKPAIGLGYDKHGLPTFMAFQVGNRVRIAHSMVSPDDNFAICKCPFTQNQNEIFGRYGIVEEIKTHLGPCNAVSIHDASAILGIRVIDGNVHSTLSEFVHVPAFDVVNYSHLGNEKGDELFNSTCDKELPWQRLLIDDSFLLDEQSRKNMENLTEPEQIRMETYTVIFKEQAHQLYHRIFNDILSANRRTRIQYVLEYMSKDN